MPFPAPHRRKKQTIVTMVKPITSIAALTAQPLAALPPYGCGVPFTGGERHGGLQYAPHCLYGARLSDLSLRGAKRRGNLAEPDRTTGKSSAKSQLPSRDCTPRALPRASRSGRHVGLRPPRNDKSVCLAPLNYCCNTRNCLRRSGSAATDAIGAHHANDSLYQFAGAAPSVAHPRIHAKTGADGVRSRLFCSFTDCCAASSSGAFWLRDPVRACGCAGSAA